MRRICDSSLFQILQHTKDLTIAVVRTRRLLFYLSRSTRLSNRNLPSSSDLRLVQRMTTIGMPISFTCACVKFVIHRSSQFYNTQRNDGKTDKSRLLPMRRRSDASVFQSLQFAKVLKGEDVTFCVLPSQKHPCPNRKLPNNNDDSTDKYILRRDKKLLIDHYFITNFSECNN